MTCSFTYFRVSGPQKYYFEKNNTIKTIQRHNFIYVPKMSKISSLACKLWTKTGHNSAKKRVSRPWGLKWSILKKKVHVHHSSMAKNLCSKFEHNRFTGFGKTGQNSTKTPVFEALGPKLELFQKKRFTKTIVGWQRTYVPNLSTIGSVVSEK